MSEGGGGGGDSQMQGTVLLAADYSMIEMRILAAMSGDAKMINLFRQEGDVYRYVYR
jgi:DNA polymerase I-like protein with 3'-5' exonuclease and polymerase domains